MPTVAQESKKEIPVNTFCDYATVKKQVQAFWQSSPCDSQLSDDQPGTGAFYRTLDERRYRAHPHLFAAAGFDEALGLRVLEIGCGCGSDAEQFSRAGAVLTAMDLTGAAVRLTRGRFELADLPGLFIQADAEGLPFANDSFDLVYSHGVLHHTPDIQRAVQEVHRVLAPGGRAIIMLYYRHSFNYQINLRLVRRSRTYLLRMGKGLRLACWLGSETAEELRHHAELIEGDPHALDMRAVLNRNTDGPDNPLSQVFSRASARRLFWQFGRVRTQIRFWNPNWLPVIGRLLPAFFVNRLASVVGWHMWIYAEKSSRSQGSPDWQRHGPPTSSIENTSENTARADEGVAAP